MAEQSTRADWSRRPFIGPFSVRHLVIVLAALLVLTGLLVVLTRPVAELPQEPLQPGSGFVPVGDPRDGLSVGDRAPELEGEVGGAKVQLYDLDGNLIRLEDLRGKVVWINFWATWCPPCQEETPVLRDVYEKYHDEGLALVAISVQETTVEDVRRYVDLYDLDYTVAFDGSAAIFHAYRAYGLPTQLFLDRDGVIRQVVLGPISREQAERIVEPLLEES